MVCGLKHQHGGHKGALLYTKNSEIFVETHF